jgi:PAS domain S-box-containing protein
MLETFNITDIEKSLMDPIIILAGIVIIGFGGWMAWNNIKKFIDDKLHPQKPEGQAFIDVSNQLEFLDFVSLLLMDDKGRIITVTNAFAELFNWEKSELAGKPVAMLIPERFRSEFQKQMSHMRTYGGSEYLDVPIDAVILKKGNVESAAEVIIDKKHKNGNLYFVVKVRDVSKYNREAVELKRKLAFYRNVERMIKMGGFEWNFPDDKVEMSEGMLKIFGLTEMQNFSPSAITMPAIVEEDQKRISDIITTAIEARKPCYEAEFMMKNGCKIKLYADIKYSEDVPALITGALRIIK